MLAARSDQEPSLIPLPVILVMFLLAFGGALLLANLTAFVRLRRDGNWPPYRPVGMADDDAHALSRTATREHPIPSRPRILTSIGIGLAVSLWAIGTLIDKNAIF